MRLRTSPSHPLCVFDIMGNHPTGETFPSCKIPARYLRDTWFPLVPNWYWPVRNYIEIPICPITHLHTIIQYQYSGFEDTYHTIGKNPIDIDAHLRVLRSPPRSWWVFIPRVDTRKTSETRLGVHPQRGCWRFLICPDNVQGTTDEKLALISEQIVCSLFLFAVLEPLLLLRTHGRVQQAHMHSWVGLKHPPPSWSTNIPTMSSSHVIVPPKDVRCLSRQWSLPKICCPKTYVRGAWVI